MTAAVRAAEQRWGETECLVNSAGRSAPAGPATTGALNLMSISP